MNDIIVLVVFWALAFPIACAILSTLWDHLWHVEIERSVGTRSHWLLTCAQAGALIATLFSWTLGLMSLAALYGSMAVGIVVLRMRGRTGNCGCFGSVSSTQLSYSMAFANAVAAVMATVLAMAGPQTTPTGWQLICLFYTSGIAMYVLLPAFKIMSELRARVHAAESSVSVVGG